MMKVTLVGTGNVAHHLKKAFSESEEVHLVQVLSSRSLSSSALCEKDVSQTDIFIIAVSDDAIESVSQHFNSSEKLVVHTSGSVTLNSLSQIQRRGVFYPLQTFSKERNVDFKNIPICLEANRNEDLELLKNLARTLTDKVYEIDSEQRKAIHLAAVFVNNFSNHLYQVGYEICEDQKVPFDLLKPLIRETADKIETLGPLDVQTGPAKRNDLKTIENHLTLLKNKKHKEIYSLLTESIQDTHGEKL